MEPTNNDGQNSNPDKPKDRVISDFTPPTGKSPESNSSAVDSTPSTQSSPTISQLAAAESDDSDDAASSQASQPTDASSPTAAAPTVMSDKRSRASKLLVWVICLILLVSAGIVAYALLTHKSIKTTSASTAPVEKDIANIRYVTTNTGWDKFYPGIDNTSNYEESNREIFEGLVRYENRTKIVPLLATGWTNPDPSTWVFTLKQGVKFHTGRTMTADDVKASFDAMKGTDLGDLFGDTIDSVTVNSPYQVTIKTTTPDATLLNKLTSLYVFDTKSGKQNDPVNGTGAYTIKPGTTGTANSLELVAFDQYHGGRPHVRSVSFIGLSDSDHGKAYADNKADIMSFSGDAPTAVGSRKYTEIDLQPLGVRIMPLNTLKGGSPLANQKVRQALAEALDPTAIATARGVQSAPATQLVPKAIPGFNPNVKALTTHNVAAAKQLLSDAGYPNGFTMKLTYFNTTQAEAAEIAKEAAAVGITIKLDPQTDASRLGAIALGGKTDAFTLTQTSDILDSSDVLSSFDDTPNYHNQAVIDLVTKAQGTLDAQKRIAVLQQANQTMAEDAGVIPLYTLDDKNSIIYDPSYVVQRDIENNDLGIYFWKVYAK